MPGYLPPSLFQGIAASKGKYQAPQAPALNNPANLAQALTGAFGGAINVARNYASSQSNTPSIDDLWDQLTRMAMGGGGGGMPSTASMRQQAMSAVGAQYDPQIAAIERLMAQARTDTSRQQGVVRNTYGDLANMSKGDVKTAKGDAKQRREIEKARATDYADDIKSSYQDSMQSITDQLNQLGIQDAGPNALGTLAQDMGKYQMQGAQDTATQQAAINTQEAGNVDYYREGGHVANLAGAEGVQQLSQALQDYLFQQQGQIGDLEAQKQQAFQAAFSQLQNNAAQAAAQQQNDTWDRLIQIYKMQQDRQNQGQGQGDAKFGPGLTGASNYLTQQFQNSQWGPQEGQRYLGVLQELLNDIGSRGRTYTPEQLLYEAVQKANQKGISPSVLQRAMAAYLGKG